MNLDKGFSVLKFSILCYVIICCSGFSFLMPYRIYIIVLFALCMLAVNTKNYHIHITSSPEGLLIIIFISLIIFGVFTSYDRTETLKYLCIYLAIAFLLITPSKAIFHEKVFKGIEICGKISAISVLLNVLVPNLFRDYLYMFISGGRSASTRLNQEISSNIFSGILGEKGEAAYMMVIVISILLAQCAAENKISRKNGVWFCIYLIALLLPAKRMLFAIGILICMMYLIFWTSGSKKIIAIGGFGALGCIGFLVASNIPVLNTLISRFISYTGDDTANGRVYLWERAIEMYQDRSLFGYGYGSFNAYASNKGVILTSSGEWISQAHNIYYQLLGEMGIAGLIVFSIIAMYGLLSFYKLYLRRKSFDRMDYALLFVGGNIQIITLIYGLSGNCIYYSNQVMVYFWGIALMIYLKKKHNFLYKKRVSHR